MDNTKAYYSNCSRLFILNYSSMMLLYKSAQASILVAGGHDPQVMGSPLNIITSYNGQEYEMRTLSKAVTFQK